MATTWRISSARSKKACTPPECKPVTFGVLRTGARLTLADPLLYFSVFGFAKSYITEGTATSTIPMIPLGRLIPDLPLLGFQMTPYGTEHIFRNLLARGSAAEGKRPKLADVTLRFGNTGASRPWAIDPRASEVRGFRSIHVPPRRISGANRRSWRT